jgi:aspartate/tyrosine/aromatic aminotransferase
LIIPEQKGTCSTKHAFLKQLAIEQQQEKITLCIGIYQMNEINTKGVGSVLDAYQLAYIPEAHTYLKIDGTILDVTRTTENEASFEDSQLSEQEILPYQIASYKVAWHQNFLKQWIEKEQLPYSFQEIWKIREKCIEALSQEII